tara:strand:- start:16367 stop:16579 length:213 start_codon:yes stop_codon:yes gene_type:complete
MGFKRKMKLSPVNIIPVRTFQKNLLEAKTMRSKLAICFKKLSEQGAFSDASPELHQFREELQEFLPEELR